MKLINAQTNEKGFVLPGKEIFPRLFKYTRGNKIFFIFKIILNKVSNTI